MFLSKLTHLFLSVPAPPTVLQEINSLMFSFLWNNKPDKVKRNTICGDYLNGGLKMINIFNFERALKLNWIRKVIHQTEASWKLLLLDSGYKLSNITLMGGSFPFIPQTPQNDFWQIVFEYWKDFSQKNRPKCNEDISQSSIWHNYQLSKYSLLLVSWYNKGIRLVGDILHEDGSIISHTELNSKYNFSSNIFDYQRTKLCTKKFIKTYQTNSKFSYERPNIPFHIKPLFISKSGSKDFYKILTDLETQEPSCKRVWEKKLNLEANDATWRALFKGSLKIVTGNYLRWFQYKILYNILDTNDYLFKIKVSDTNLCRLGKEYPETTVHLFVQCPQVICLWNNIIQWIKSRLLIQIDLTNARKILGYEQYDQHFWPLNFLLLISRQYIFSCAKNYYKPNIYFLQKNVSINSMNKNVYQY